MFGMRWSAGSSERPFPVRSQLSPTVSIHLLLWCCIFSPNPSPIQLSVRPRTGMPELCPESWGHPGDQGEQRTSGGPARLVPLGGQGEWVPSHRVCVRKGCLEFSHICFLTAVTVLNTFSVFSDDCRRDSDCGYLLYYIWMIT